MPFKTSVWVDSVLWCGQNHGSSSRKSQFTDKQFTEKQSFQWSLSKCLVWYALDNAF